MKTPRTIIARIITDKLGKQSPKRLSHEVAAYLLENNRVGELDSLLRDVQQQRADVGMVEAVAVSAHPLTDKVRSDIKAQVKAAVPSAKSIIISEQLDPDMVGGVKIELANQQLDLSIRSKLNKFKQLIAVGEK
jgi:F0F1-type ATP synthase delta subunit